MLEIRALTSLRGLAAMAVVMQHFSATAQLHSAVTIPSLVPHGYVAVDLFFVLSGFIMAYTYEADFEARGLQAFPNFLGKRVARIVPLNLVTIAIIVLAGAASEAVLSRNIFDDSHNLLYDVIMNALMLQGLGIGHNLNGPSWSISTEFAAYFLFPMFLALVMSRRRAAAAAALIAAASLLCLIAAGHPRLGLDTTTTAGDVGRCFTEFVMGVGCYRAIRVRRIAQLVGRDAVAAGLLFAAAAMMALRIDLFAALLFPVVVASLACNRGRVAAALGTRIPYFLGVISFSIYLLHSILRPLELEIVRALHPAPLSGAVALLFALVGSLTVIPFAWLAYVCVERPGRAFVRGMLILPRRAATRV
jgi:peptidoglycan/LPS O-acetylase OafA/YrhL